jgi:predicted KAP-like P-loop ATPase
MISNDSPITDPKDDQFGIDNFAKAIAKAIEKLAVPDGTVIALTGPWGSGKSSAVNLMRYYLKAIEENEELKTIVFNPWWYSDEPALTRAFFQHLYAGLGSQLSRNGRRLILSLGKKLLGAGPLISGVSDLLTFGIWGKIVSLASSSLADMIKTDRTSEDEHKQLSDLLRKQSKKYLIIIDDIDRLIPEQTLSIFRLVKSVGRLPNVAYLLVFDRELAERLLAEKYPSERHFLEKVVQAAFEIPLPDPTILHESLLQALVAITGHPEGEDGVRFRNTLSDAVNPLVQLPRDLARLMGNFSVSWAAVGEEVDPADLAAIEALRLFRFELHQKIRTSKDLLCGTGNDGGRSRDLAGAYNDRFLSFVQNEDEKNALRIALRRLFPRLDSVWSNMHYDASSGAIWRAKRRICDPIHFSSYFRLSISDDALPKKLMTEFLENISDKEYVQRFFRARSKSVRKNGKSDVPLVFDELMGSSKEIPGRMLIPLLGGLFEIFDELDLERDEDRGGFNFGNHLRMQWLLNEFVRDKLPQTRRNVLFRRIFPTASFEWSIDLMRRIHHEHFPVRSEQQTPLEMRFVDSETAANLKSIMLTKFSEASRNGILLKSRNLLSALYRWREFLGKDSVQVREWIMSRLDDDTFLFRLIDSVTSTSWTSSVGWDGLGDRVSRAVPHVQLEGLDTILDVDRFLNRVKNVSASEIGEDQKRILDRFNEGMRRRNRARDS